jgi:RNA recognition motif-containing protein
MDPDEKRTKLFVNYLPQSWTDIDLNSIFMEIGPLKEAKVFKDAKTNYSFGYGIVNYESPDDAAQAVKTKNGFQIGGKKLKVVYSRENFGPETKIYLKFIGENEAAVRELFLPFGEILDFKLLKYQGNLRGDGFVRFAKTEQAKAAILAMNGVKAPGTDANMLVKMAEEHGKQKGDYFAQCLTTQIGKRPNNYQQQPDFMSKRSKVDS